MDSCFASCSACTSHLAQAALKPDLLFAESQDILASRLVSHLGSVHSQAVFRLSQSLMLVFEVYLAHKWLK